MANISSFSKTPFHSRTYVRKHTKVGKIQRKVLILLAGGLSLAFSGGSYGRQRMVLRAIGKEWQAIDRDALREAIRALYRSKLVDFRERGGGVVEVKLNDGGKERVRRFNAEALAIAKPKRWDGKWRIVCFDIPKAKKKEREVLRFQLKLLGFYQFQKSVFVHPYPCGDEIDFLIELYDLRLYVRQIVAVDIDVDVHLRHLFGVG
jgi:hypothetical protein